MAMDYQSYLQHIAPLQGWMGGGDAGTWRDPNFTPMSEGEWNAMSNEARHQMLVRTPTAAESNVQDANRIPTDRVLHNGVIGNDADTAAFRAQFGAAPWQSSQSGQSADEYGSRVLWGYGELPTIFGHGADQYMIDPSRVQRDADGRWMIESDNIKGPWMAEQQALERSRDKRSMWAGLAPVLLAGVGGALGAFGGAGAGAGAAVEGGTLAAGPGMGFGTAGYGGAASAYGGAGAAAGAGTGGLLSGSGGMDAVSAAEWVGGPGAATNPSAGLFGASPSSGGLLGGLNIEMLPNITQPTMGTMVPAAQAGGGGILSSFMSGDIAGGLGQLGSWAASNPVQAYGAIQTIGGLLGGSDGSSGGSSGGSNGGGGGGLLNFAAPKRPQFSPNPYLQAQLARGGYA